MSLWLTNVGNFFPSCRLLITDDDDLDELELGDLCVADDVSLRRWMSRGSDVLPDDSWFNISSYALIF
ncbi:hypothetical protein DERF_004000 [Dermatophagoides farinae]|uniref:Uncharacterized protein n=1 Tax=Dermatophagoides farinae TaxID=6954 RepID=A0A922IGI6_DERFA|nr:hypothetical protein DERF_009896 [Dermatophagoides farinae]KAH9530175.1 hypothetical protein DERF_004000 [Dermatophagoides farinae]